MQRIHYILAFLLFLIPNLGFCQGDMHRDMFHYEARNDVFIEAGAQEDLRSSTLNLERQIATGKWDNKVLLIRLGGGYSTPLTGIDYGFGGLAGLTMLTGQSNHHFELGGGLFIGKIAKKADPYYFGIPLIDFGYRYQKPDGGFLFRAKGGILGYGLSFGYSF